jgi:hypothetical protein
MVTGNWPISWRKVLVHPEIQLGKKEVTTPTSNDHKDSQVESNNTPTTSRHIRDLGKKNRPPIRRRYSVLSKSFKAQESTIATLSFRVASLEEEVKRLNWGKKRRAIPNPNRKSMTLAEALVVGDTILERNHATVETGCWGCNRDRRRGRWWEHKFGGARITCRTRWHRPRKQKIKMILKCFQRLI